ncbi:MAG TPA: nitrile hydratase subunit beta [Bryobacteraceae bacterium]|nr:nitrile hydratase subunit beta [Bryobacteraceae bacterium]
MNGIHDMGGMQDMGPIDYDPHEPVFHESWEGRVWALMRATAAFGPTRRKNFRYELEILPPVDYLRMSYYERFFKTLTDRLLRGNAITQAELDSGHPDPGASRATPRLTAGMVDAQLTRRVSLRRDDVHIKPRFKEGHRVRARNINPLGHTRLPRYVRGRIGTIVRDHGIFNLQDTDPDGYTLGNNPQHVYTVRFHARDLWGDQASTRDSVLADLWDNYLEHA